jgi:hypothetical protein
MTLLLSYSVKQLVRTDAVSVRRLNANGAKGAKSLFGLQSLSLGAMPKTEEGDVDAH